MNNLDFRIYHKLEKRFINKHDNFYLSLWPNLDDSIVLQRFTGKKDALGNKIFEGDVVDLSTQVNEHKGMPSKSHGAYEVFYKDKAAAFYIRVLKKSWGDHWFTTKQEAKKRTIDNNFNLLYTVIEELPIGNFNRLIVVGNIFDVVKCGCGGDIEYSGEALMGCLKCKSCEDYLCGIGSEFLKNKTILWYKGERGFYDSEK